MSISREATGRIQLALNVSDLEAATATYSKIFDVEPAKRRNGYVNFEITDPPLKLVLFERPDASSPLNHLGVELTATDDVAAAAKRFEALGLAHRTTEGVTCCHAVQNKVWVDAPDVPLGAWEFYTVLSDAVDHAADVDGCCTTAPDVHACCASDGDRP